MGFRRHGRKNHDRDVQSVSDTMVHFFQSQGIKVMRYNAYSTASVYLKLDYGLLYTIWGWDREFIAIDRDLLNQMCLDIVRMRSSKIRQLGLYGYQEEMDYRRERNAHNRGFWEQAKDLG